MVLLSLLGPLLLNIFVNDVGNSFHISKRSFADDMKIYTKITTVDDANALQSYLSRMDYFFIPDQNYNNL